MILRKSYNLHLFTLPVDLGLRTEMPEIILPEIKHITLILGEVFMFLFCSDVVVG